MSTPTPFELSSAASRRLRKTLSPSPGRHACAQARALREAGCMLDSPPPVPPRGGAGGGALRVVWAWSSRVACSYISCSRLPFAPASGSGFEFPRRVLHIGGCVGICPIFTPFAPGPTSVGRLGYPLASRSSANMASASPDRTDDARRDFGFQATLPEALDAFFTFSNTQHKGTQERQQPPSGRGHSTF